MSSTVKTFNVASFVYALVCTVALAASCASNPDQGFGTSAKDSIENVSTTTKSVGEGLDKDTKKIDENVKAGESKTPASLKPVLNPHWMGIQSASDDIKVLRGQLAGTETALSQASENVQKLSDENSSVKKENAKLKDDNKNAWRRIWILTSVIGAVGLAASVGLFAAGNKKAVFGGIGSISLIGISILLGQYSEWVALGTGVVLLAAIGFIAYNLILKAKEAKEKEQKAKELETVATELAKTNEIGKMAMREDARRYVYGNGPVPGQVDVVQSFATKQFVRSLRKSEDFRTAPSVKPALITGHPMGSGSSQEEPTIVLDDSVSAL